MVRASTCDQAVVGSILGWAGIKLPRFTQPSILPGLVNRVLAWLAGVMAVTFTCVGWQVTLCDPIWQVMLRSSVMGFPLRALLGFLINL